MEQEENSSEEPLVLKLRDQIERGVFETGTRLREEILAQANNTSRTSVRAALKVLEAENLVAHQTNRGFIIPKLTLEDAMNVYQIREVLEGLAAKLFTERATSGQVAQFRQAIEIFGKAAEEYTSQPTHADVFTALFAAKNAVYARLLVGTGNHVIAEILQSLRKRIWALRRVTLAEPGRSLQTYMELKDIVVAIENQNPEEAERASVRHVRLAAKIAYSQLRNGATL